MSYLNSEILYRYSKARQNKPGFTAVKGVPPKTIFEIADTCRNNESFGLYCTISCFGTYSCAAASVLNRNPISTFDLIYICKGEITAAGTYSMKQAALTARTGEVVLVSCNCKYDIVCSKSSELVLLSHYGMISEKYYEFICKKDFLVSLRIRQSAPFQQYLNNLYFYTKYAFQVNRVLAVNTMTQILTDLYLNSLDPQEYNLLGQPKWIQQAFYYMESNYMHKVTIADIAGSCGLSTSHFHKLFRDYTGLSPYDYLMKIRLTHARSMLLESDDLVKQIASAVGLSSVNHFITFFKRETGLSPEAYRLKYRLARNEAPLIRP